MSARLLADVLLAIHFGFVLFVIFGGLPALWKTRWWRWHLPALAWGIGIEITGGICPLTTWEADLRLRASAAGTDSSFVDRWIVPVLYPAGLERRHQWALAAALIAFNVAVYAAALRRARRRRLTLPDPEQTAS